MNEILATPNLGTGCRVLLRHPLLIPRAIINVGGLLWRALRNPQRAMQELTLEFANAVDDASLARLKKSSASAARQGDSQASEQFERIAGKMHEVRGKMVTLSDQYYNERVFDLLFDIGSAGGEAEARRRVRRQIEVAMDCRYLPALMQIRDVIAQQPGEEERAHVFASLAVDEARTELLRMDVNRVERGGMCTALMTSEDHDTLKANVEHFEPRLDDEFFAQFDKMAQEFEQRGIGELAEAAKARTEAIAGLLTLSRLDALKGQIPHSSPRAVIAMVVDAARLAPRWLSRGLDTVLLWSADMPEPQRQVLTTLPTALRQALDAFAAGQEQSQVIETVAAHRALQVMIGVLQTPPEAVREFVEQPLNSQALALAKFMRAQNEVERAEAIADEPALLTEEAEYEALRMAAEASAYGDHRPAQALRDAADRLRQMRNELASPEQNIVARLAQRVIANELSLADALTELEHPGTLADVTLSHASAVDGQIVTLRRSGNLANAEVLAALNLIPARRLGNPKLHVYANISVAEIKIERGSPREMIPLMEEAEQLAHEIGDQGLLAHAVGMMGMAYRRLDDYPRAIERYENALNIARAARLKHVELVALDNLAAVYSLMGKPRDALTCAEHALQLAEETGDLRQRGEVLGNLAVVLQMLGQHKDAIEKYREALQAALEFNDVNGEIRIRSHLGQAYADLGESDAAMEETQRALALAQQTANRTMEASLIGALGGIYYQRGDLNRTMDQFERALELEEELGHREKQAIVLTNLGQMRLRLNQVDTARQLLERARQIAVEIGSAGVLAGVLSPLGRCASGRSEWAQAEKYHREALELADQIGDPSLRLIALGNLGRVLEAQNQLEQAAQTHREASMLARALGMRPMEMHALLGLGTAQAKSNDNASAHKSFVAAAQLAQELGNTFGEYRARANLGLLYETRLNKLPKAVIEYARAIELLEAQRSGLSEYEEFEKSFIEDKGDVYRLAAEAYLKLEQPLEALEMVEKGRARLLARHLMRREVLPPNVPEELRERCTRTTQGVQMLRTIVYGEPSWGMKMMDELRRGVADLQDKPIDEQKEQQEYKQALVEAEAELARLVEAIRAHAPNFGGAEIKLPRLDFAELASDTTTAVVALFIGNSLSRAIILHPSGTRVVDLPDFKRDDVHYLLEGLPKPLAEMLQDIQQKVAADRTLDRMGDAGIIMHFMTLRWMIEQTDSFEIGWLAAVRTLIAEKEQSAQLERINRRLPSEFTDKEEKTLFDIDDAKRLALWKRVFDYTIRELNARFWQPLLSALRECGAARIVIIPDANLHSLPLAIGITDETDAPSVMMAPSLALYTQCAKWLREREPRENTLMLIVDPSKDLSAAKIEAKLLRDLFAAHSELTFTLQEDQATQLNVVRTSRVGNYWHFAGHAKYVWQNPSLSHLSLANDETLPLYWVPMWMDLRATRLAVLSACETGMTPARDPAQEFAGLFTAFLTAGAPTVLASLWPVENVSTALMTHRFYQYHLGDPHEGITPRPPADALHDAQAWLRQLTYAELIAYVAPKLDSSLGSIWIDVLGLEARVNNEGCPFESPYFWAGFVLVGA
jgi:CHAT domain-containing protein/tetratricopeptide (TPR) repeat protein